MRLARPRVLALLALTLLTGCTASRTPPEADAPSGTAPPLWGALPMGPWGVGLRVLPLPPAEGPALQLTVWYPSRARGALPRLRYRDYVGLRGSEQHPERWEDSALAEAAVAEYRQLLSGLGLPEAAVSSWLDAEVAATRGAPPAAGRFPLVLVAQGRFHSAHHQAVLAEHLASHGYVVATTPFPARLAPPAPDEDVLALARGQAHELTRALQALRATPGVDASRVALVAHSFGARAAFLFAREHPETAALVSLDGGLANHMGREWLAGLEGFRPEAYRVPTLHLYQEGDAAVVPDFDLLRSLRSADRWLLRIAGLRHLDFTSVGAATAVAPALSPSASTPRGWAACAHATRSFLEAHVLQRARALESLALPPGPSDATPKLTVTHLAPGQP